MLRSYLSIFCWASNENRFLLETEPAPSLKFSATISSSERLATFPPLFDNLIFFRQPASSGRLCRRSLCAL